MKRRFWPIVLLTVILFLTAGCGLRAVNEPHEIDPANEPTPVPTSIPIIKPTYTVDVGDIAREITLSGVIVPVSQLDLTFEVPGEIAIVHVEVGQEVTAGDLLAELDVSALEAELAQAQSSLELISTQLANAELAHANNLRRAEIAVESVQARLTHATDSASEPPTPDQALGITLITLELELAQLTLSELESNIDPALEAQVSQAQLRVDEIVAQMGMAQLVAPVDGTILRLNGRADQLVSPADVIMIIADIDNLEVRARANAEDLELMALGMAGAMFLTGRPDEPMGAELTVMPTEYGGTGQEENIVRFVLEDLGASVTPNDRVTVRLIIGERNGVLWLPPQAIREFRGRQFVVVEDGEGQRRVDIETGLTGDNRTEIVTGLEEGQVVIGQ